MRRGFMAVASLLLLASPRGLSAQTIRREGSISLPSGVSVSIASVARAGSFAAGICSDNVVRLWALPSGKLTQSFDSKTDRATGLQLSDDGRLLAIATQTGSVKVWDIAP
jgi:WD40 repeat protein